MNPLWTIDELARAVEKALVATAYAGQKSARIRQVPDPRTIRYYTTLGLLDKPAEMRGRTAYYGPRHLLQLLAIKRLQAAGKTLVEIQGNLAGAGQAALARWADLPDGFLEQIEQEMIAAPQHAGAESSGDVETRHPDLTRPRDLTRQVDFWAALPPALPPAEPASHVGADGHGHPAAAVTAAVHLKVLDQVTLVIEGDHAQQIDARTLARLEPVLRELRIALLSSGGGAESQEERRGEG